MSLFPIILAVVIVVAVFCWLTGYRLPIQRRPLGQSSSHQLGRGVNRSTRQQLMRRVGGNAAVAQRLVERVKMQNPGRSEQWCWEKAIYDIERDRRA
ncbi:hypothetical protein IQ241_12135 [Romeria aff. gracilis LEGE 07310]|uniref:Uncharacterized protein n=1 Tax=Vasconcelosia minhoensis LEGE 07310 TaxID=915328 RepID=A0A8J7AVX6_9CYAN|nr:hypothetical protein [Romeria gracilis]MBE9078033.1 hypothetical protein [Romeria aff. gracilis LEGE 07310]